MEWWFETHEFGSSRYLERLKDHGIYKGKAYDILKGLEALHIWKSEIEKGNYLFN